MTKKLEKLKNEKQNIKIIKNIKNKQQLAFPWSITASDTTITASDTTITASNTTTICHYCLCHQYYYCQWHCYCRRNFFPTSETTIVDGALQVYDAKVKRCLKPQTLQYHSAPMQTSWYPRNVQNAPPVAGKNYNWATTSGT